MELFCALLTGFFLWLFVYQWRRKSVAQLRRLAGDHWFTARSTVPRTQRGAFFIFLLLALLGQLVTAVSHPHLTLGSEFGLAGLSAIILFLGIPSNGEDSPGGARSRRLIWPWR